MGRAQYSLLHLLWPGYVRRTDRSIWCTQCAVTEQLILGNLPDGYCIRIRATLEFCHEERIAARLVGVHDCNHLGEHFVRETSSEATGFCREFSAQCGTAISKLRSKPTCNDCSTERCFKLVSTLLVREVRRIVRPTLFDLTASDRVHEFMTQ